MEQRSNITDGLLLRGKSIIILYDKDGNIKEKRVNPNIVVQGGKYCIGQRVANASPGMGAANIICIGTGTAGLSVSNTALYGFVSPQKTGDLTQAIPDGSWQVLATWGANEPAADVNLNESGVFFGTYGTWMLARQTFGTVTKLATDILTVKWEFVIS